MTNSSKTTSEFFVFDIPKDNSQGPIVMEQVLSALHGINEAVSFEIWSTKGKMQFAFHSQNGKYITKLLESHYPGISIRSKKDYSEKLVGKQISTAYLTLESAPIFPIRRYSQTADHIQSRWTNPYSSILPSLNKLQSGEVKSIQIILQPAHSNHSKKGLNVLYVSYALASWWMLRKSLWVKKTLPKLLCNSSILRMAFWLFVPHKKNFNPNNIDRIDHRNHGVESAYEAARSKLSQNSFHTSIRLIYAGKKKNPERLKEIASSFSQFGIPEINSFTAKTNGKNHVIRKIRQRQMVYRSLLSIEELAGVLHLPTNDVKVPELQKTAFRPIQLNKLNGEGIIIGKSLNNDFIKLSEESYSRHIAIIGKSGTGKSTFMLNIIREFLQHQHGFALLDPHGDLLNQILNIVPKERVKDIVLVDPTDIEYPVGFNVLQGHGRKDQITASVVDSFRKLFAENWGPRTDYLLFNAISTLAEVPNASLLGIPKLLYDEKYRKQCLSHIHDAVLLEFWTKEYKEMPARLRMESIAPILNKIGRFLAVPIVRNILGQKNKLDIREAMDSGKILLINLSKGILGEDNSALLGNFFLSHFQLAALSRADMERKDRVPFTVFVDELQHFVSSCSNHVNTLYSEGRKYKVNLVTACQYLSQLGDFSEALFGNISTLAAFGISHDDAEKVIKYLPEVETDDLVNLPAYSGYLRRVQNSQPEVVSFTNIPPTTAKQKSYKDRIIKYSREKYSTPRNEVEQEIEEFFTKNTPKKSPIPK